VRYGQDERNREATRIVDRLYCRAMSEDLVPVPAPRVRRTFLAAVLAASTVLACAAPRSNAGQIDPLAAGRERYGAPVNPASRVEGRCGEPRGVSLYAFPERPAEGGTLRFVAVAEMPRDAKLVVYDPNGQRVATGEDRRGGPPYSWVASVPLVEPGTYSARLAVAGDSAACTSAEVEALGPPPRPRSSATLWSIERVWDTDTENLYSAWIEKLFDDPIDVMPSWKSLHAITRDPERNFLHDSLGLGEDSEGGITLEPDCADLPYFLRAYFAWKMRLPFMYSRCYSGGAGPPVCRETKSNLEPNPGGKETLSVMQRFFARCADAAHSATGRTAAADDRTDVYPVRIDGDTLRPGTVFIDPYGHVLIIAKRVPQTRTASGLMLAIDAQPDGTVARKRFWRGNFLFALSADGSAPGFKRFRPVVPTGDGGVRTLDNAEIARHPAYGDFSLEQYEGGVDGFYDKVDAALSPNKRPPRQVLLEIVDSLEQQVKQRVDSVQGGEDYMNKTSGTVSMPGGAAIFQTVGAWEDYATPSRDLRLLIAIDVVRDFPKWVVRRPERFLIERGRSLDGVRRELEGMLEEELASRSFSYTRSDGTPWTLKLSEVIERAEALEMGYNPNDCIEKRWGAPAESIEVMPCRRSAPAEQLRMMQGVREWFSTRTRPST
jgi:hypothetical protein